MYIDIEDLVGKSTGGGEGGASLCSRPVENERPLALRASQSARAVLRRISDGARGTSYFERAPLSVLAPLPPLLQLSPASHSAHLLT
eukprot:scaffold70026_cov24-Tisochrysis_lutea.AAC.2